MASSVICPTLHKLGISPSILLEVANDSDTETLSSVPCVTNEIVVELYHFMNQNSECTYYTLWRWLSSLLGDEWPTNNFPTVKSVRQSVIRIVTKLNKLRKLPSSAQKSRLLSCFLSEVYHIPTIFVSRGKIVTPVSSSSSCSSCAESEVLKAVNTQLCQELSALSVKASSLKSSDEKLSETRYIGMLIRS